MRSALSLIRLTRTPLALFALCFLVTSVASLVSILPELFIGHIINAISGAGGGNAFINAAIESVLRLLSTSNKLLVGLGFFLLASILTALLKDFSGYCATVLSETLLCKVREILYSKLTRISYMEHMFLTKGRAVNVVMNDTAKLSFIFERPFYTLLADLFDLLWIAVFLMMIDINILLILLCAVPVIYVASIKTGKVQKWIADDVRAVDTRLTERVEQTVSGYEIIKSLNAEDAEERNFGQKLTSSLALRIQGAKSLSIFFPIEGCIRALATTVVGAYVITQVNNSALSIGMVVVGIMYSNKFFAPIRNLSQYYQMIQKGIVAAEKIVEFLNTPEENRRRTSYTPSLPKDEVPSDAEGDTKVELVVDNLSLAIGEKSIFSGLSFSCHSGQFVLLKGNSGSGKTSLFRALLGFYDVPDGRIRINRADINTYDRDQLRRMVAYVSQKSFVHNDTVVNNICYPSLNVPNQLVRETIDLLNLAHLETSPMHYEEGKNLSGGELARISFARAVLRKPQILLLDETISSLDSGNVAYILAAIEQITSSGAIVLMATHNNDVGLLERADAVIRIPREPHNTPPQP